LPQMRRARLPLSKQVTVTNIAELVNVLTRWDQHPSAHDCSRAARALESQAAELATLRAQLAAATDERDVTLAENERLRDEARLISEYAAVVRWGKP
jgi:hypothetical protein